MHRLLLIFFIPFYSWADCSYEKSVPIAFSSDAKTDVLTVRVVAGDDCSKAFEHIMIKRNDGYWLYEYYASLQHYFRNQEITRKDVIRLVEVGVSESSFSYSNRLPAWEPADVYYENHFQEIKVTKEQYVKYSNQNWLIFSHQVGYEGRATIVFDRDSKTVKEISSGSP